MISMWSRPRKPQRKPNPSAADVSGSKWNDASLRRSFSSASRSSGYSLPSTGYSPAKTIDFISLKPGNGSDVGFARSEEHTSELQSRRDLVCRLLLEKKKTKHYDDRPLSVELLG